jgi:hypothetical protein
VLVLVALFDAYSEEKLLHFQELPIFTLQSNYARKSNFADRAEGLGTAPPGKLQDIEECRSVQEILRFPVPFSPPWGRFGCLQLLILHAQRRDNHRIVPL